MENLCEYKNITSGKIGHGKKSSTSLRGKSAKFKNPRTQTGKNGHNRNSPELKHTITQKVRENRPRSKIHPDFPKFMSFSVIRSDSIYAGLPVLILFRVRVRVRFEKYYFGENRQKSKIPELKILLPHLLQLDLFIHVV